MSDASTTAAVGIAETVAVVGVDAVAVTVEAHVSAGLPGFGVIGSSGTTARQAADRVRTALASVDPTITRVKVLVSLAPAEVPKAGAGYDLAVALAVLAQRGLVDPATLTGVMAVGELALDGSVRAVRGILPSAAHARRQGARRLFVASACVDEARAVTGLDVVGVDSLVEAVAVLRGDAPRRSPPSTPPVDRRRGAPPPDLADVRGQPLARRALEVAAAGAHHLLLLGPPGCGKSMLARRLPGLLPPLGEEAALQLATVRSVTGTLVPGAVLQGGVLDRRPPLRAPHHTISAAALLGGGSGVARPGEISLAAGGVLFLDELLEWPRAVLDALRQPLEDGVVRVARSRATVTFPADVQLVAAANPCPCGGRRCACDDDLVWRYRSRLSGPLADRLDLAPTMRPLRAADLSAAPGEPTEVVGRRVAAARATSLDRDGAPSAKVAADRIARSTTAAARRSLGRAVELGELSGRGHDRALRVARTIADLAGATAVDVDHVDEAVAHRIALTAARAPSAVAG